MLLTLLRHGEVDGRPLVFRGRSDPALSARGMAQLHRAARAFADPSIDELLSSPSRRCLDFCAPWAQAHEIPLRVVDALREIDFGDWEELSPEEARARDPECYRQLCADPQSWCSPNGEPYRQFRARVLDAMHELRNGRAVHLGVVTHAGVIRVVLGEVLNIGAADAQRIALAPGSSCRLWYEQDRPQLLALGAGAGDCSAASSALTGQRASHPGRLASQAAWPPSGAGRMNAPNADPTS